MASGPYFDPRRGTWSVQYSDGVAWHRVVVIPRRLGWQPKHGKPKKVPPEALAAVKHYADLERAARRRRPFDPGRTIAAFLADYRALYAGRRTAGSLMQLERAIKLFLDWCGPRKLVLLDKVTAHECRAWIADRARQTSRKTGLRISYARLRQERALLAAAWARAVRNGELAANPWVAVEVPARAVKGPKPSWTPGEFARLLAEARPWLRDILVVGVQTGLRISALLAMDWSWVKWARSGESGYGWIEVPAAHDKAGKGYRVPISRTCHDVLFRRRVHRDDARGRVLTGQGGGPSHANNTGSAIIRACKRAGLPRPTSPNHHLRRSFGRWAILGHLTGRPVPLYVVMSWMGHSHVTTTETYLDLHRDDSSAWMDEAGPSGEQR